MNKKSVFSNNFDILNLGVDSFLKENHLYRQMQNIVNNIEYKDTKFNKKYLYKVKDFVHYYQNDWEDGNPLKPAKNVKWRCRLAAPFRKINMAILALRACNRLDLLEPIIKALEENGIHLSIDADNNSQDFSDEIEKMDAIQSKICSIADTRMDARDDAAKQKIITKSGFNESVKSMYKIEKERLKVNNDMDGAIENSYEHLQDLISDSSLNSNLYLSTQKFIKDGEIS